MTSHWLRARFAVFVFILIVLAAAGCRGMQDPPTATAVPPSPVPVTATAVPTETPAPPTATATPTETPTPSATPTPTPTPTPTHPLMIEVMREQEYSGSDVVIEQTLGPGVNYDRYVVSYEAEGLTIYALLTVPQGERPESGWPVIIFNHGYIPPAQYRTTERYVAYVDGFARNGYIVLKPDYRGHGSSEGEPSGAFISPDYTVDVLNAVASMQRYPDADPERVGMWGHSMGGTLTLRSMVVVDDIKAGVIWAGVVAPIEDVWKERRRWIANYLTETPDSEGNSSIPDRGIFAYGTFDENPAFWASVDPVYHLDELSGPIQLHHGTGDESVPVAFSEDLYARLQEAGQPAELYLYEGDNHNLSNQFATVMQRSVAFFDEYVKGE